MKTILKKILITLLGAAGLAVTPNLQAQPTNLIAPPVNGSTNYTQNFDSLTASGLPTEWVLYTVVSASSVGTISATFKGGATNGWADTSGGFKNYASSTNAGSGTNFLGSEPTATQNTDANRVLGVRPVTATDAGNAFVLKLANTTGIGKFILDVDMMLLNPQGRSNNWQLDFGISPDGINPPTSFTVVSNNFYGTITTNGVGAFNGFGAYHRTLNFGSLLDNQPGPIWVRIWHTASTGANARPTVGIDNVSLTYSNVVAAPTPPVITTLPATNTTVYVGDTFTLNVANSGTAPFTYQWYKDNYSTPVGVDSANLLFPSITAGDAGTYYVVITNVAGATTNNPPAVLTVGTHVPIPTTIYRVRTNQDASNWSPLDTTNFYTVTGIVITRTNVTTAANASFYIEDTNSLCGMDVFIAGDTSTRPTNGDIIQVTGPIGQFNGVLEFNLNAANPTHIVTNLGPSGYSVPAKPFADFSAAANFALMETNYEGSLVVVSNVLIQFGGTGTNYSSTTFTLTNQANQTFPLFIDSRLADILGQPIPAGLVNIKGYISQFKAAAPFTNGYQLVPTYIGDIVAAPVPSTNSALSTLTITSGALSPAFDPNTLSYSSPSVPNATTSVTVTPTSATNNATIQARVNGGGYSSVTSGLPSGALALNVGANTVDVKVTAQDTTTVTTYSVTVTRAIAPPTPETITNTVSSGNLILSWGQANWSGVLSGTNITQLTMTNLGVTSPYTNLISGPQTYFRLFFAP